jgi:hypothetical protein
LEAIFFLFFSFHSKNIAAAISPIHGLPHCHSLNPKPDQIAEAAFFGLLRAQATFRNYSKTIIKWNM